MIEERLNTFAPDYAVHPGEILGEFLEARGMKKSELAERTQLAPKTISQIINGRASLTPETAVHLERVLGVSATVWSNLDGLYRLHMAKKADREKLETNKEWVKRFPIGELAKRGFLSQHKDLADALAELLDFFGVASIDGWNARYAKLAVEYRRSPSFTSSQEAVITWLRIGELKAENIETESYVRGHFKASLTKIRGLTREPARLFEPAMKELCRNAGVALTFVPELPKTRLSGVTRWLRPDKALITMSLRHRSDDHFWFTFFHEAGHILLHGKKDVYIDEADMPINRAEEEANRFASEFLMTRSTYASLIAKRHIYRQDIIDLANQLGIAPGIVVGRLQHDNIIEYKSHNTLKRRFKFTEETPRQEA